MLFWYFFFLREFLTEKICTSESFVCQINATFAHNYAFLDYRFFMIGNFEKRGKGPMGEISPVYQGSS